MSAAALLSLPLVAGILSPLENVLRHILDWLGPHGTIGLPWAWSIVALTVIVRIVILPLTVRQIHSMQSLQRHAPEMKEIQRKFKHDKQKQQEELMRFYRENKINPAASCLPIILQIPVFLALYFVLKDFEKDLAHSGDNLEWLGLINITDKASVGWGPLLLVIYVGSQFASTYFMSTAMDKTQRMLMLLLPFFIVPFVVNFKAGLVLYWATTNLWTVGQGVITRRLVPRTAISIPKRTSRTPPREDSGGRDGAKEPAAAPKPPAAPAKAAAPRRVKKKKRGRARR
jgi:YidC/Oxa1 family membrane protein insertase